MSDSNVRRSIETDLNGYPMNRFLQWLLRNRTRPNESPSGGDWSIEFQVAARGRPGPCSVVASLAGAGGHLVAVPQAKAVRCRLRPRLPLATLRALVLGGVVLMLLESVLVDHANAS